MKAKNTNPFDGMENLGDFGKIIEGFAKPAETAFQKEMRLLNEQLKRVSSPKQH